MIGEHPSSRDRVRLRLWQLYNNGFDVSKEGLSKIEEPVLSEIPLQYQDHQQALLHSGIDPERPAIDKDDPSDKALINRYQITGDISYANQAAMKNYGLLVFFAKRISLFQSIRHKADIELAELVNEAYIRMVESMKTFDCTRGHALATYIADDIRRVLTRYVDKSRHNLHFPGPVATRLATVISQEKDAGGVRIEKIREAMGNETARHVQLYLDAKLSLQDPQSENQPYEYVASTLPALLESSRSYAKALSPKQLLENLILHTSIAELDPADQEIVKSAYGIATQRTRDCPEQEKQTRISERHAMSRSWANARLHKAHRQLQKKIEIKRKQLMFNQIPV